jgi:hypothetical protein
MEYVQQIKGSFCEYGPFKLELVEHRLTGEGILGPVPRVRTWVRPS